METARTLRKSFRQQIRPARITARECRHDRHCTNHLSGVSKPRLASFIDAGILRREMTLDEAGEALIELIGRTANGRNTAAEALGHREFVMTKLYRSA